MAAFLVLPIPVGTTVDFSCRDRGLFLRPPDSSRTTARWKSPAHLVQFPGDRVVTRTNTDHGSAGASVTSPSYNESGTAEELKKAIIRAVANTNRGKATTPDQRRRIVSFIQDLEELNPTPDPINSPLLSGLWSSLYTAPIDDEPADKFAGVEEGPFLYTLKPLALGSVRQTRSSQIIDTTEGTAANIADFTFFGVTGSLTIRGRAVKAPATSKGAVRLNVTFDNFDVKLGGWQSPTISLTWVSPKGWVDTTYLDGNFRIGRGDKGSVFVAVKAKPANISGETYELAT